MQTTRKPTLNWLLTGGLLLGLAAASQAAITTIADSFTLNGTTRTAGAALGGLTTEVGGATWTTVGSAFYFDADGTVAGTTASWTAPQASVALPAVTGLVTLTADAKLSNASDGGQWCAIGFMANDSANWFTDSRQLSAYVKYDGSWSLMTGNGTAIASGDFGTPGTGFYALSLVYDPSTNKAKFAVGGTTVANWTSLGVYTPTLGAAALRVQSSPNSTNHQQFDNFVVTVPEPASLGLLLVAGGLLAARRRRG